MEPYLALICIFGGNFAIRGWAFCQGQLLSIAQNSALFSLLGTTYGGDGQTTFALPDLRGRAPIGIGQGPGLPNYVLGQMAGTTTTTLLITNMPAHNHIADPSGLSVTPSASTANGSTNIPAADLVPAQVPVIGSGPNAVTVRAYGKQDNTTTLAPGKTSGTIGISMAGGSQPFNIQDPYLAMNYLIATAGIFPPRS
ncbi:phage tail protein [Chitinophaga alhagiae]|uniref:phage tail protein n=1 Tax=Chitinophaga alhagiae TaxID=2203219 RepID=UPI000E5A6A45|nr:tail fiber protein [Chitinophaga alhagiae]